MTLTSRALVIAVLSMALIALQILLTRIFSVLFLSHLGFAAISIGMLGLAAAGVRVYAAGERFTAATAPKDVARATLVFAAMLLSYTVVLSRMGANALTFSWSLFSQLAAVYCLGAVTFYFGGLALTLMLTKHLDNFGTLYAADLLGAGIGGVVAIQLLRLGGLGAVVFVALCMSVMASMMTARTPLRERRIAMSLAAVAALTLVMDQQRSVLRVEHAKGRVGIESAPLFEKWNALSRVAVQIMPAYPWGVGAKHVGDYFVSRVIEIDSSASTGIVRQSPADAAHLKYELTSLIYTVANPNGALIIGAGGGRDLYTALTYGQKHVDAVEINPIIVDDIMRGRFADISGHIYDDPRVTVHTADGRSFVRGSAVRYDAIQLSLVDTWAATAAGAFATTENNLYTTEALQDYIEHLSDGGVLSIARWSGADIFRLLVQFEHACRALTIEDVAQHLALIRAYDHVNGPVTNILFRRSAWTDAAIATLHAQAEAADFDWEFDPRATSARNTEAARILMAPVLSEAANVEAGVDVRASTDDWPFFFFHPSPHFWGDLAEHPGDLLLRPTYILVALLAMSIVASGLCVLLPLWRADRVTGSRRSKARLLTIAPYFACLGLGFMFTEVCMTQRFVLYLGHPTHALTVVLTTLLLGAGFGASLAPRLEAWVVESPRRLGYLTGVATFTLLVASTLHPVLFGATPRVLWSGRVALAALAVFPPACMLGLLMPSAMALLTSNAPEEIPWAWGINGFFSVVGSCGAALCAVLTGFSYTAAVGVALYAMAGVVALISPPGSVATQRPHAAAQTTSSLQATPQA